MERTNRGQGAAESTNHHHRHYRTIFFFGFVITRVTYGDYGEIHCPFPVRCPREGGSLQAPFALRPDLSQEPLPNDKYTIVKGGVKKKGLLPAKRVSIRSKYVFFNS
jgi:hypothetical protein